MPTRVSRATFEGLTYGLNPPVVVVKFVDREAIYLRDRENVRALIYALNDAINKAWPDPLRIFNLDTGKWEDAT